ncbi:MAG: hypothetical protein V1667_00190 [bacterium]
MFKKNLLTLSAFFLIAFCLPNFVYAGWHELSQSARNQAIINAACRDLNQTFAELSCKKWVQNVVKNASGGAVSVPQTVDPPGYYWYSSQYTIGRSSRIENAKPGEIIQMDLTNYTDPHTAIVLSISAKGITFIECNWCSNNCKIVSTRYVDFSTFYKQVVNFSIYYVR